MPYLSIVVASRNDNHGGDLTGRTQMCFDSLSRQLKRFGVDAEVIVVDWNPPAGNPPLSEVVTCDNSRFITVPSDIHNRYGQARNFPLFQMIAKNAGIRRARGEFILATNVDILFSDELMEELAKKNLQKGMIYRAYRFDVKKGTTSLDGIKNKLIRLNLSHADELCTNACGDFQLLHRDDWFRLRGYFEGDLFSIHIDSVFEYHAYYNGCKEFVFSPSRVTYHVEHSGGWVPGIEKSKEYNRMNDVKVKKLSYEDLLDIISLFRKQQGPFDYNKENWGLADDILGEVNGKINIV